MLSNCSIKNYSDFHLIFTTILDRHAPMKTKFLRRNNSPHVTFGVARIKNFWKICKPLLSGKSGTTDGRTYLLKIAKL